MPVWVKINMPVSTQILYTFPPPGIVAGAPGAKHARVSSPGAYGLCYSIEPQPSASRSQPVPFGEKGRCLF